MPIIYIAITSVYAIVRYGCIAPIDEPLMASLLMHVSSHVCCLPFTIGQGNSRKSIHVCR